MTKTGRSNRLKKYPWPLAASFAALCPAAGRAAMVLFWGMLLFPCQAFALPGQIVNGVGMNFILVHPGTYAMGSPEEEPHRSRNEYQHQVDITSPFYMQDSEVTLGQWRRVMPKKWLFPRKGADNLPVTRVSFHECEQFIGRLNRLSGQVKRRYRLPTEEEWEYVCRAGTTTAYSFGETIDCSLAMYANNPLKAPFCVEHAASMGIAPGGPAPVKSFPPNPWGFYDMHGNVWEWVSDEYRGYQGRRELGLNRREGGQEDTRVRRGGSWFKYGHYCRSANRAWAHPGGKFKTTGFRVVLEVAP